MLQHVAALHFTRKRIHLGDGGVGNDKVKVYNPLFHYLFHCLKSSPLDTRVVLDNNELTLVAPREISECLGGWVAGVPVEGDDRLSRSQKYVR